LRNDKAAMEREMTYRVAKFEAQGHFEHQEAVTLACQGRLKEAAQRWDRALILARLGGFPERAALFQGARAVWECDGRSSRRGTKERIGGVIPLPGPGRRLWTRVSVGASRRFRSSSQDRSRPRNGLPGLHLSQIQLSACAAGARSAQSGRPGEGARNDTS